MAAQKRALEESSSTHKHKKTKVAPSTEAPPAPVSQLVQDEVDFPRGGGSSLTPLEIKSLRAEAAKEADQELFNVRYQYPSLTGMLIGNAGGR